MSDNGDKSTKLPLTYRIIVTISAIFIFHFFIDAMLMSNIVLAITGGIAAYKSAMFARLLIKAGFDVVSAVFFAIVEAIRELKEKRSNVQVQGLAEGKSAGTKG